MKLNRSGILSLCFVQFRFGYNSESIRDTFQNGWHDLPFVHTPLFEKQNAFEVLEDVGKFLNLFTVDPDVNSIRDRYDYYDLTENNREYYTGNTANNPSMRAGVLSFGFGPFRFGRNSEKIRHIAQNKVAHDWLMGGDSYWFLPLSIKPRWYWYFGSGSGNTLW